MAKRLLLIPLVTVGGRELGNAFKKWEILWIWYINNNLF